MAPTHKTTFDPKEVTAIFVLGNDFLIECSGLEKTDFMLQ
jgi:hypothetical protein